MRRGGLHEDRTAGGVGVAEGLAAASLGAATRSAGAWLVRPGRAAPLDRGPGGPAPPHHSQPCGGSFMRSLRFRLRAFGAAAAVAALLAVAACSSGWAESSGS